MAVALFSYKNRNSFLHRIHPLAKLIVIFSMCIFCFMETEFELIKLLLCFAFSVVLFFLGGGNKTTLKALPFVFILGLFVTALRMFYFIPKISFNADGFYSGLLYTARLFITTLTCQIIFETTSSAQIQDSLEKIENAFAKVIPPVKKLHAALLISLAINFIPMVFETWTKVKLASQARSNGKKNIFTASKTLFSQLDATLSCLIFRAETKRKAILNRWTERQ
ncbi:MAG: energy-coupling factor transporter transmembrane component T [Treponema sp.]|nr:energy-coupling factor transporter transmembrane protein EcfT [Spirochaetia bacterium]MDD7460200.1 energy-coupling factor transporter transmembrane component T [Spirochaetales bacterium]MDY5810751.1 energy-coupling factor transporter transmembrane component T [Treponema sp.]MEE1180983.1 energy-coupling factor transporter transmembrane component T [Treponema sp.]